MLLDKKLPRVAHMEKRVDGLQAILAAQHKQHMYERALVRYPQCRSNVFAPSSYDSDASAPSPTAAPTAPAADASSLLPAPQTRLELDYVYGLQTGGGSVTATSGASATGTGSSNGNSVHYIATGELLWFTAALVILFDPARNAQRYFREHTSAVTSVGVHPNAYIVASGQTGRQTHILVWNAKDEPLGKRFTCLRGHAVAVRAISFSHDGKLVASLGGDLYNTICVHDWKEQTLLATARGHSFRVHTLAFNPFQACGRPETRRTKKPGQALHDDDVCYTLVSCGVRHIRFWTLTRTEYVAPTTEESVDAAFYGSAFGSPTRLRPATPRAKMWKLEGNVPSFHGRLDVQDFTSLTFVDDSPPLYCYDAQTQELVATNARDHTLGRIVAGTAKGDLCVFYQPRKSPDASDDAMARTEPEREPAKWWEIPDEYSDAEINALVLERIAYEPTARLVELVPHDVETGSRFKLTKQAQAEIDGILKRLTLTPNAPALHARLQELKYSGAVGHADGVTQLAYCRKNGLVLSCGGDGKLLLWQCVLQRPVRVPGVNTLGVFTSLRSGTFSEGAHQLVPVDHDTRQYQLPSALPGDNTGSSSTAAVPKPTSFQWRDDGNAVLVGTSTNCLWELTLATGEWCLVFEARSGAVVACACHPMKDEVVTVSHDSYVSVWDLRRHSCKRRAHLSTSAGARAVCLALDPFGDELAVGMTSGELVVLDYTELKVIVKKTIKSSGLASSNAVDLHAAPASGIAQLKYCPLGTHLAVGARDTVVYVYSVRDGYKKLLACEGHSSAITQLTWSADGELLQTNASDGELLYWSIAPGSRGSAKQITDAFTVRDTPWVHWTCVFGWPTPGIWVDDATSLLDIAAVCTTNGLSARAMASRSLQDDASAFATTPSPLPPTMDESEDLIAVACRSTVRLLKWPAMRSARARSFAAHAAAIPSLSFSHNDAYLVTVGGDDSTVIQWKCVRGPAASPTKPSPVARKRQQRMAAGSATSAITNDSGDASISASSPVPPPATERSTSAQRSPRQHMRQYRERQERESEAQDDGAGDHVVSAAGSDEAPDDDASPRQVLAQARALHDFDAQNPDELSFQRGELLRVLSYESDEWWRGERCDGTRGIFPATYVEVVHDGDGNEEGSGVDAHAYAASEQVDDVEHPDAASDAPSSAEAINPSDASDAMVPQVAYRDVDAVLESGSGANND